MLYTNAYAVAHIAAKPTYANANGQWTPTTRDEMYSFLALLLFQAYLKLPDMGDYWSTESLFDGNYARSMIPSRKRFKALLTFLKIVDHEQEDPDDRLRKVRFLYDTVCEKCQSLFVPGQCLSVDERMIKHKGRAVFKQYLPKKPVKWGFKVFAVCDADTGMLCKFEIYTGQAGANDGDGLTHAVVLRLTEHLAGAGRILFTDNFYTSPALAESLLERGSHLVGTVRTNRRGYPMQLKTDLKNFEKHAERGETRYVREGNILVQQWKDRRVVSMLSTMHRGDSHVMVTRHTKVNGQHVELNIRQPTCVRDYNKNMGGVDTFDQRAAAYRTLRRTNKYWKSNFLDIIDIVAVNSFLLFQQFRQQNPGVIERPRQYRRRHFHSNLIRQLAKIDVNAPLPKRRYRPSTGQQPLQLIFICLATESKRGTASTAGTQIMWSENACRSAVLARCTCTPLDATASQITTCSTFRMFLFVVSYCCFASSRHCTKILSDFAPSLPNFAKKLKTRNFDTSFGQHSLTFFYYFAHFCFAMQPSFQKMYGLLFAILLPF